MTQTTGFVWHEKSMWHDNGAASGTYPVSGEFQPGIHVENPETKRRLKNLLDAYDVTPELTAINPIPMDESALLNFHTPQYVDLVKSQSRTTGGSVGDAAWAGPGTFDAVSYTHLTLPTTPYV